MFLYFKDGPSLIEIITANLFPFTELALVVFRRLDLSNLENLTQVIDQFHENGLSKKTLDSRGFSFPQGRLSQTCTSNFSKLV